MSSSQSALPSLRLRCRDEKGVLALKLGGLADPQAAPLTAVWVNVSVTDVNSLEPTTEAYADIGPSDIQEPYLGREPGSEQKKQIL